MGASLDYLAGRSLVGLFAAAAAAAALWGLPVTPPPPPIHFTLCPHHSTSASHLEWQILTQPCEHLGGK